MTNLSTDSKADICPIGCTAHLQLLLPLQGKLFEGLDNDPGVGAVVDEDGRAAHPRLQVVDGQRDVLGVVLGKINRGR